jgi:hypothetical protein
MRIAVRRWMLVVFAVVSFPAQATLFDRGDGLIYDDVLDVTWLQDANIDGNKTWLDAVAWAGSLVFQGFDVWRLPSADVNGDEIVLDCDGATEAACRDNELGYMYWHNLGGFGNALTGTQTVNGVTFNNIGGTNGTHWSGTEFADTSVYPNAAWDQLFANGKLDFVGKGVIHAAWAVLDGDVVGIPEPTTTALLALGLLSAGIAGKTAPRRQPG